MVETPPAPSDVPAPILRAPGRLTHVALAAILCAAALLRFVGLDHGLRRGDPLPDEYHNFIAPVLGMWDSRSPDPDVHAGYPGLFNYLAFLPMGIGRRLDAWNGAAVGGRALVAAFGTLNVFLVFRLVQPVWGAAAALFGAALLALSRSEVSQAHAITPDILVVTAFLAMALALRSGSPRSLWPGVWSGLGLAIKHSGVILFPALLAELAVQRQLRRRLVPILAAAAVALTIAAPYAVVFRKDALEATRTLRYYSAGLQRGNFVAGVGKRVERALGWTWVNLGTVGSLLAFAGLALARPRRALVVPAVVLLTTVAVVSMPRVLGRSSQVYPRHVLLAGAAATVLAAAGYAALARQRWLALGLAAAALAQPAWQSVAVAAGYAGPSALDRAASWIEDQARPLTVATSLERFRLDPPAELRNGLLLSTLTPEALSHYDFVLAPRTIADRLGGFVPAAMFEDEGNPDGAFALLRPAKPPTDVAWPAPTATSGSAPGAQRAFDGDPATAWTAPAGPGALEALWDHPRALHLIEVLAEPGEERWPQRLVLMGRAAPGRWEPIEALPLRPTRTGRQHPPHGQVFLLTEERSFDGLRVERGEGRDWGLAEVRAFGIGP